MAIEMIEHRITARVPELTKPTNTLEVPLSIRVDPLTGHTSRIVSGTKLSPTTRPDLSELTADPPFCPFCAGTIEQATGTFPAEVVPEGRIRRRNSVVVPNVLAYSEFSSVGLYDTTRHFLDLPDLTASRVGDLLGALVDYTTALHRMRPMWSSINANYLPPSGSSLVHPHAQSAHDDVGTTLQRLLVERSARWQASGGRSFWDELLAQEQDGPRWVGRIGRVCFLTPFAPIGFHEVWAVVDGCRDLDQLTEADCADLGAGMSRVFAAYADLCLTSFNWALYGGGPASSNGWSTLLRIVSRSNAEPMYRSDVTYFEKLHSEAMVDLAPEDLAQTLRPGFGG
jgi:UDPglucose--hexose-1-phosphate uridylyltransferase